jgi:hypothetical protein
LLIQGPGGVEPDLPFPFIAFIHQRKIEGIPFREEVEFSGVHKPKLDGFSGKRGENHRHILRKKPGKRGKCSGK